jgi:hypothetical protein
VNHEAKQAMASTRALRDAREVLQLDAESLDRDSKRLPSPRTLTDLKADPGFARDLDADMIAAGAPAEVVNFVSG